MLVGTDGHLSHSSTRSRLEWDIANQLCIGWDGGSEDLVLGLKRRHLGSLSISMVGAGQSEC
jgi:hypothetical protein